MKVGRALDFGCGVGRLTRALADRFDTCDGVDVAASMVERARALNGDNERVRFHHNDAPDLQLFGDESFDFILALIVLQHMEPRLMRGYLREFLRVLRPGGVAYFNIPEPFVYDRALPAEAWQASVSLASPAPPFAAGRDALLTVKVRNDSEIAWPASAEVRVGNHWRSPDGTLVVLDDARSLIPTDVEPGMECDVQLRVVAPDQPGDYELEIDLLQELVGWFADRGSTTLKLPVTVDGEPDGRTNSAAAAAARATGEGGSA